MLSKWTVRQILDFIHCVLLTIRHMLHSKFLFSFDHLHRTDFSILNVCLVPLLLLQRSQRASQMPNLLTSLQKSICSILNTSCFLKQSFLFPFFIRNSVYSNLIALLLFMKPWNTVRSTKHCKIVEAKWSNSFNKG